jgi:hypothetical protein
MGTGANSTGRAGVVGPGGEAGPRDDVAAIDGTLYVVSPADSTRIRATDLTRSAATTTVYTAPGGTTVGAPFSCGPARICFSEHGPGRQSLAGFDIGGRRVLWRHDGSPDRLQVADGQVSVAAHDRPAEIYDAGGRQLLRNRSGTDTAGWIDGRSALLFRRSETGSRTDVSGVTPLDGEPVPLGSVTGLLGCGWSRTHLTCLTEAGIKVWRFAT